LAKKVGKGEALNCKGDEKKAVKGFDLERLVLTLAFRMGQDPKGMT
jgi:hypothetical protein